MRLAMNVRTLTRLCDDNRLGMLYNPQQPGELRSPEFGPAEERDSTGAPPLLQRRLHRVGW